MPARRYASVTARSVAHQTAIRHKLALIIDGRQRSARSQSNDARTPTEKSGRRSNKNSVDLMIGKRSKSRINVMLRCYGNRMELHAEVARGWLHFHVGNLGIENKSDCLPRRDQVVQKFQPFGQDFAHKEADAS